MSPPLINPFLVIEKKSTFHRRSSDNLSDDLAPRFVESQIEDIALTRGVPIEDIALTRHFIGGAPTICRTTEPS
jgi:hypothetical protein